MSGPGQPDAPARIPVTKTVIFVSGRSPAEEIGGGHCSYVRAHARAAIAAGYEVHLYAVSETRSGVESTGYGILHHIRVAGSPVRQRYIRRLARPLADAIAGDRDVWSRAVAIHSFGVWSYAGHLAVAAITPSRRLRHVMSMYTVYREESFAQLTALQGFKPVVRLRHLLEWIHIRTSASRCERIAYRTADTVAVNYRSVETLVRRLLGPHPDLRIVPYGPESAFLAEPAPATPPERPTGQPPLIMTITLQRPKKGVRTLLEAFAILKGQGVGFRGCIVGGGALKDDHERYMQQLGLSGDVSFAGFVERIEPWLKTADLYVQPSIREESGALALLEAMLHGRPVVCSAIDGMAEDIRDGIDGLTVPPGDAHALAAALRRLLEHPEERARFAAAAQSRFAARHGNAMVSRSLQDLYEPHPITPA